MNSTNERIARARAALKLSGPKFADSIGISAAKLRELEQGGEVSEEILAIISDTHGVSLQWLQTGENSMFKEGCSPAYDRFFQKFERLPDEAKEMFIKFIDDYEETHSEKTITKIKRK